MADADPRVGLLIVGDEILSGRTRDANGGWLAARLDALGYRVARIVVAPDEDAALAREVLEMLVRVRTVVVSGGLGPTHDDRTTLVLARLFGRDLVIDEAGWRRLEERYAKRFGGEKPPEEMVESARKMVRVPAGARPLPNPVGAATAYVLPVADAQIIVLPGVPAELQAIWAQEVEGKVLPARPPDTVVELEVAMAEAAFAGLLERVARAHPDVAVGSYPHWGELRVTLRFRGPPGRAEAARDEVRADLAPHVVKG